MYFIVRSSDYLNLDFLKSVKIQVLPHCWFSERIVRLLRLRVSSEAILMVFG